MRTLHLNLKKKWFDMILSGEKKEEYREIKPHWISALTSKTLTVEKEDLEDPMQGCYKETVLWESILYGTDVFVIPTFKHFDSVTFSNGYAKDRPQFEIEFKGFEIREGKPEWGAITGTKYFVLLLGKIIK